MPETRVVFFRETDGSVPVVEWLRTLDGKPRDKCTDRISRLAQLGHELRRPKADYLRDGIYELRVGFRGQNYRMLYFFHDQTAAVVSHGLLKERVVPPAEIELATSRRKKFLQNPGSHTFNRE